MTAINRNPLGLSRESVAVKLLVHGPLTGTQFADITGWPRRTSSRVLSGLMGRQRIGFKHHAGKREYELIAPAP